MHNNVEIIDNRNIVVLHSVACDSKNMYACICNLLQRFISVEDILQQATRQYIQFYMLTFQTSICITKTVQTLD